MAPVMLVVVTTRDNHGGSRWAPSLRCHSSIPPIQYPTLLISTWPTTTFLSQVGFPQSRVVVYNFIVKLPDLDVAVSNKRL